MNTKYLVPAAMIGAVVIATGAMAFATNLLNQSGEITSTDSRPVIDAPDHETLTVRFIEDHASPVLERGQHMVVVSCPVGSHFEVSIGADKRGRNQEHAVCKEDMVYPPPTED